MWALSGRAVSILKVRPLVYLGRVSYTVYLVHTAALAVMREYLHHYTAGSLLVFAITLLYAALSWRFIEQPILRAGKPHGSPDPKSQAIQAQGTP